ncbi:hypothetical protein KC850_04025, partial [Candidatus Kaiserbacteria bacterium]|nr:hypothetical protein [Candidatus Kaiserbacteria bacterium]
FAPAFYFSDTLIYMDPKIQQQLDEQEVKINEIFNSVKKIEKYMKITFWVTVVVIVLPLIIMMFALPSIISSYTTALSGLEGII